MSQYSWTSVNSQALHRVPGGSHFVVDIHTRWKSGFSTVLAILLTGFLIVLSSGVLFLFLSESKINRTLLNSTAAFHAAEWAMEYALLKAKNHREGFSDALVMDTDDSKALTTSLKWLRMGYELTASKAWSASITGSIAAKDFEIIPLFYEEGALFHDQFKDPRWAVPVLGSNGFMVYKQATNMKLTLSGATTEVVVWNIIGNDVSGKSYGIANVLSNTNTSMDTNTSGTIKIHDGIALSEHTETVDAFLSPSRSPKIQEPYLMIYNTSSVPVEYVFSADTGFSLPRTEIIATGKIGNITTNLRLSENKTALFEALKYSVFVP